MIFFMPIRFNFRILCDYGTNIENKFSYCCGLPHILCGRIICPLDFMRPVDASHLWSTMNSFQSFSIHIVILSSQNIHIQNGFQSAENTKIKWKDQKSPEHIRYIPVPAQRMCRSILNPPRMRQGIFPRLIWSDTQKNS